MMAMKNKATKATDNGIRQLYRKIIINAVIAMMVVERNQTAAKEEKAA